MNVRPLRHWTLSRRRPFPFTNLKSGEGAPAVQEFIEHHGMLSIA